MITPDEVQTLPDPDRPSAFIAKDGALIVRASAITQCTRALIGVATGWDVKQPPQAMQQRYDDGHLHEADIINRTELKYTGKIVQVQVGCSIMLLPNRVIVQGTGDAVMEALVGFMDNEVGQCLIEAKSMAKSAFADWKRNGWKSFPGYAWQISIYMIALGRAYGYSHPLPAIIACKNKDSGEIDYLPVPVPPISLGVMRHRAIELWKAYQDVATNRQRIETMQCDKSTYPCPIYYVHDSAGSQAPADTVDDPVLDKLIVDYVEARTLEANAANLKDQAAKDIRARMAAEGREAWKSSTGFSVSCRRGTRSVYEWDKIKADWPGLDPDLYKSAIPTKEAVVRVTAPQEGKPIDGV
jgi:hypothetical protein